jgi:hypothetical protein
MFSILVILAAVAIMVICMGLPALVISLGVRGLNDWTNEIQTRRALRSTPCRAWLKKSIT